VGNPRCEHGPAHDCAKCETADLRSRLSAAEAARDAALADAENLRAGNREAAEAVRQIKAQRDGAESREAALREALARVGVAYGKRSPGHHPNCAAVRYRPGAKGLAENHLGPCNCGHADVLAALASPLTTPPEARRLYRRLYRAARVGGDEGRVAFGTYMIEAARESAQAAPPEATAPAAPKRPRGPLCDDRRCRNLGPCGCDDEDPPPGPDGVKAARSDPATSEGGPRDAR
jgi:hypothetical protein